MRIMDVLFLVEHIARELDVVTCLAQKLRTQFGIEAEIKCQFHDIRYNLQRYQPRIVVFPMFYGARLGLIEYLSRWPEAIFVNLGWEQILMQIDVAMKTPRDDAARQRVLHICWTQKHQDFLSREGARRDHLLLTGNPAMKLYDPPYRNYFESRAELARRHKIDPQQKWVLFPESYQYAFMTKESLQCLVDEKNADMRLLEQARGYSERCLSRLFAWVDELRSKTDPLFILRPRPDTTPEQVIEHMRRAIGTPSGNMAVIQTGSVREWILAADHVISSHSTTLIEAALAGKPIHLFSPEAFPEALAAEWHRLVPLLADRDAFLDAIRQSPMASTGTQLAAWARAQFLEADPLDAIARAIAQLHRDMGPHGRSSLPDYRRLWSGRIVVEVALKWRRTLRFASARAAARLHRAMGQNGRSSLSNHRWLWNGRIMVEIALEWLRILMRDPGGKRWRGSDVFGAHDVARRVSRWQHVLSNPIEGGRLEKVRDNNLSISRSSDAL